jgi:hypothetical protein
MRDYKLALSNVDAYKHYGGRGIKVCREWYDFMTFRDWALSNRYDNSNKLTLDRQDNNLGYNPEDCRFATHAEQARNRRATRWITVGCVTLCLKDWCKEFNIRDRAFYKYLRLGLSDTDALLQAQKDTYTYRAKRGTLTKLVLA